MRDGDPRPNTELPFGGSPGEEEGEVGVLREGKVLWEGEWEYFGYDVFTSSEMLLF